jgi:pSer/pThr/pTyr-binding forkhead associated (FHA) protein
VIICKKCGKDNQDHYKFCLGCGSELKAADASPTPPSSSGPGFIPVPPSTRPPEGQKVSAAMSGEALGLQRVRTKLTPEELKGPSPAVSPTPPAGVARVSVNPGPSATEGEAAPTPGPGMVVCSQCGTENPKEFMFCGNCGNRLQAVVPQTMYYGGTEPASDGKKAWGKISLIRPDGSEGGGFSLEESEIVLGRGVGPLFDSDGFLSPRHTTLTYTSGRLLLEDMGSLNGVFVKITREEPIATGAIFRIGQELLRFDLIGEPQVMVDGTEILGSPNPGYWGRLSLIVGPSIDGSAFPLVGDEVVIGRERGDILFSDDGYVSGTHSRISIRADGCYLTDLGSSNGTFIRILEPREIFSGTFLLMGQQLFRIDIEG